MLEFVNLCHIAARKRANLTLSHVPFFFLSQHETPRTPAALTPAQVPIAASLAGSETPSTVVAAAEAIEAALTGHAPSRARNLRRQSRLLAEACVLQRQVAADSGTPAEVGISRSLSFGVSESLGDSASTPPGKVARLGRSPVSASVADVDDAAVRSVIAAVSRSAAGLLPEVVAASSPDQDAESLTAPAVAQQAAAAAAAILAGRKRATAEHGGSPAYAPPPPAALARSSALVPSPVSAGSLGAEARVSPRLAAALLGRLEPRAAAPSPLREAGVRSSPPSSARRGSPLAAFGRTAVPSTPRSTSRHGASASSSDADAGDAQRRLSSASLRPSSPAAQVVFSAQSSTKAAPASPAAAVTTPRRRRFDGLPATAAVAAAVASVLRDGAPHGSSTAAAAAEAALASVVERYEARAAAADPCWLDDACASAPVLAGQAEPSLASATRLIAPRVGELATPPASPQRMGAAAKEEQVPPPARPARWWHAALPPASAGTSAGASGAGSSGSLRWLGGGVSSSTPLSPPQPPSALRQRLEVRLAASSPSAAGTPPMAVAFARSALEPAKVTLSHVRERAEFPLAPAPTAAASVTDVDGDDVSRNLSAVWGLELTEPTPLPRSAPRPLTGSASLAAGQSWLHTLRA